MRRRADVNVKRYTRASLVTSVACRICAACVLWARTTMELPSRTRRRRKKNGWPVPPWPFVLFVHEDLLPCASPKAVRRENSTLFHPLQHRHRRAGLRSYYFMQVARRTYKTSICRSSQVQDDEQHLAELPENSVEGVRNRISLTRLSPCFPTNAWSFYPSSKPAPASPHPCPK